MESQHRVAFGRDLRRMREQRGVSLSQLARDTKVPLDLWDELERGDLVHWPTGLFARSFVRAYAQNVGAEPDRIVDEFCRLFPQGDRRASRLFREQAAIVGHASEWADDLVDRLPTGDRRARVPNADDDRATRRRKRLAAATFDAAIIGGMALLIAGLPRVNGWAALAGASILYHIATVVTCEATPGTHFVGWWQRRVAPEFRTALFRRQGFDRASGVGPRA